MFYDFPIIKHLNDVLPAIDGSDEFIVADKGSYKIVNYLVVMPDTFPLVKTSGGTAKMREEASRNKAIRRECRGMIFDANGNIIARRYHKFFNVNERDETQSELIDLSLPHFILEKLDGSMITPFKVNNKILWGTKMGETDVSRPAAHFAQTNEGYIPFVQDMIEFNQTPIFEWCSRKQRIVIDYPVDRLVLTAVRNNQSGKYMSYSDMVHLGEEYQIDVVQAYSGTAKNMIDLLKHTKELSGSEGYVLRFDNGHMLKIKAEEYMKFHKTKDSLTLEKNVIALLLDEKVDDLKAFMLPEDRKKIENFEHEFWTGINNTILKYEQNYQDIVIKRNLDRKTFALDFLPKLKKEDPFIQGIIFGMFNGKSARDLVLDQVRNHTNTKTKVEEARSLWNGAKWNYHFDTDG